MMNVCSSLEPPSSSLTRVEAVKAKKKTAYKKKLREEMMKTFGRFLGAEKITKTEPNSPGRNSNLKMDFPSGEESFGVTINDLHEHIKELQCKHMEEKAREKFLNHGRRKSNSRSFSISAVVHMDHDESPPPTPFSATFTSDIDNLFGSSLSEDSSAEEPSTPCTSHFSGGGNNDFDHFGQEKHKPDGFDDEFQALLKFEEKLKRTSGVHMSAYLTHNLPKNRYKNILPNEGTRIKLAQLPHSEPGSDYINANLITVPCAQTHLPFTMPTPPAYIATQAPLPDTICDFWRMIWEQDVHIIAMLTNELGEEKDDEHSINSSDDNNGEYSASTNSASDHSFDSHFNRNRVQRYWPHIGETKSFGNIIVETVGEEHSQDIVTREIMILNTKQTGKKRKIHFFQYTGWPDMGVPQSVETILTLVETVDTLHSKYPNAPILTHCSAGVGRTGTFCAIHIMIQQYKYYLKKMQELGCDPDNQIDEEKRFNFNIYNIIKQLKNQRIGMVQRKEQYVFCYTTLQRWLDRQRGYTPL